MILRSRIIPDARTAPAAWRRLKGMTLVEVIVAMLIISMFATSGIGLMLLNQKTTLANFYQLEAYRLAQSIAEHAMQVTYPGNFDAAGVKANSAVGSQTEWIWTDTEQAMLRSLPAGNGNAQFSYPTGTSVSPVVFTKVIQDHNPATVGSAKVLDVIISWSFARRNYSITLPVVRGS